MWAAAIGAPDTDESAHVVLQTCCREAPSRTLSFYVRVHHLSGGGAAAPHGRGCGRQRATHCQTCQLLSRCQLSASAPSVPSSEAAHALLPTAGAQSHIWR